MFELIHQVPKECLTTTVHEVMRVMTHRDHFPHEDFTDYLESMGTFLEVDTDSMGFVTLLLREIEQDASMRICELDDERVARYICNLYQVFQTAYDRFYPSTPEIDEAARRTLEEWRNQPI